MSVREPFIEQSEGRRIPDGVEQQDHSLLKDPETLRRLGYTRLESLEGLSQDIVCVRDVLGDLWCALEN